MAIWLADRLTGGLTVSSVGWLAGHFCTYRQNGVMIKLKLYDTALQTQDTNFKSWQSEVEHATSWLHRLSTMTRQDKTRQDKTRQDKTRQDQTGRQDRTGQNRTRHEKTWKDRTRQDKTRQDKTGQDRTGQDRTKQFRPRQDRTGQDKTGRDRTGQDRTGQDRTRQDKKQLWGDWMLIWLTPGSVVSYYI